MSIGIFGNKVGMTQIFTNEGLAIPVTVIRVKACLITKIKELEKDGYNAVQVGFLTTKVNRLTKSKLGFFKKHGLPICSNLSEFRIFRPENYNYIIGQKVSIEMFKIGEFINITGKSIGKGFSGNQKRHRFKRGPMTHGSKNHRAPGSIGPGTTPGRVFPGKRMSGQLGAKQITISRLEIIGRDVQQNLLIIKGSVPGKPGNLLKISLSK